MRTVEPSGSCRDRGGRQHGEKVLRQGSAGFPVLEAHDAAPALRRQEKNRRSPRGAIRSDTPRDGRRADREQPRFRLLEVFPEEAKAAVHLAGDPRAVVHERHCAAPLTVSLPCGGGTRRGCAATVPALSALPEDLIEFWQQTKLGRPRSEVLAVE